MKFDLDLSPLQNLVKLIGADTIIPNFVIDFNLSPIDNNIDIELKQGKEISINQIDHINGLLSYAGRQVILYIKDHTFDMPTLSSLQKDGSKGRKFHIIECETIKKMRANKRFDRYVVTTKTEGYFKISARNSWGAIEDGDVRLDVCRNCLEYLNYKDYKFLNQVNKNNIVKQFDILEFFEQYSSFIRYLPSGISKVKDPTYTKDWNEISKQYRKSVHYICEECGVDLSSSNSTQGLLHVHHINGVKGDNSYDNLKALCIDCHKKQPNHNHMLCKKDDISKINELRKAQGIIDDNIVKSWEEVYKYSDTALHEIIKILVRRKVPTPRLHQKIEQYQNRIELLWKMYGVGILLEPNTIEAGEYTLYSHNDILKNLDEFLSKFKTG